ncbi:putative bifunctional diguanylate cyclase/phosphodiesterase [Sphingomonas jatrophae]|uniref:Diguanylate cyclase/phosphodiesterase n=1 Tax=Sphingomonas jatrophae TaxID=1166337 RepID=A0A1I6JM32_9SPHN|nr:GGDEF domain-containing phosphodiesterase [Sphingomonas jatrophae]SFR80038.1 diguanylate cyclase/phosphodiesterase [Sphingomonas jatrophae]
MIRADAPSSRGTPLFVLSFGARDALAHAAARGGWRTVAARRREQVERRYLASGAAIAVVDLRGAIVEGLEALRRLAPLAAAHGGVLLALTDAGDQARLSDVVDAGATLFLSDPFDDDALAQALRLAQRLVERLAGGREPVRTTLIAAEAQGWRWKPGARAVRLSPALGERLGLTGEEVPLGTLLRRMGRPGRRAARETVRRLLVTGRHGAFAHDGETGDRIVHHLDLDESVGEVAGWIEDLDVDAVPSRPPARDPLTGLANAAAAEAWAAARLAEGSGCVLLMLSVSRFDMINAAFGREAGDALLQGVARRIVRLAGRAARERLVARLAGADYLIGLAAPASAEEAEFLAARLTEAIAQPFVAQDHLVTLSARIGIAAAGADERDAPALLRRAASALAEARAGDTAVAIRDGASAAAAERDRRLEVDLRRALDADEITILFQPQVEVTRGRIVGAEALARWHHPRLGMLGAAELFAAASRSDYLLELSAHVQRRAVEEAARWPKRLDGCRIAINVAAEDMAQPGFADRFAAMVDAGGLDRGRVTLEITETGLIEDLGRAATLLAALRAQGFRVALDDFGTGYSSLAYLKALPLDYLKIDKRLSDDIVGSARDRVVVRSVIDMARSLGLTVIAEGVETEPQLALLAAEGCTLYQGYLCAPPLGSAAFARLVARAGTERA